MEQLKKRYIKDSNIVSRVIDEEVILVPIMQDASDMRNIFHLPNHVASRIWELIDGKRSGSEIAVKISEEFDVSLARAEKDFSEFLAELKKVKAVRVV